jgi:energy-coupling factor transporter transmembrane protein EcfT
MVNSLVLFLGLLVLFILGKLSFIFQLFVFVILFFIAYIKNLSTIELLKKIKYFLFALILIYPLTTPGELFYYYSFISISYEGIFLALENLFRLVNIFMLVMILLSTLPKDFFVRFLIKVCYPFTLIGVDIERLSSRLYLTFEYLEIFKKYQFKYSSITNDILKQLNSKNIDKLNNKISIIRPSLIDYFMTLIFIISILLIKHLVP